MAKLKGINLILLNRNTEINGQTVKETTVKLLLVNKKG